jgi:large subunit ribosomal protein L44
LLWSTGATHATGAFVVGIYVDKKFLAKGSGETVDIAEEMAARDALRRIYGTGEDAAPIPYGDKARKHSTIINSIYQAMSKKSSTF